MIERIDKTWRPSFLDVVGLVTIAITSGIIGSAAFAVLGSPWRVQASAPTVLKVSAVELVNASGRRVGRWGTDEKGNTEFAFFDSHGTKRLDLTLYGGTSPFLHVNGPDGGALASLGLGQSGKPQLILSDENFNGRVLLGINEPDTFDPAIRYNSWILRFRGDRNRTLTTVGMTTDKSGSLLILDESGKEWKIPGK